MVVWQRMQVGRSNGRCLSFCRHCSENRDSDDIARSTGPGLRERKGGAALRTTSHGCGTRTVARVACRATMQDLFKRKAAIMRPDDDACWPALPYAAWKDTYATLHLWSQVVGKIALALAPPLNHC